MKTPKKKREATPKAPKVSPASVDAPPAHTGGRPKGWRPADHGKDPGGRPIEWDEARINELGAALIEWSMEHTACYLESFCREQRTYPQKLSELATQNPKFSESLKVAKSAIASHIAEATAGGEMPPAFGIFALKQRGWTDKQEIEHSGEVNTVTRYIIPSKRPIE